MIRTGSVSAAPAAHESSLLTVELDPLFGCDACASAGGCGIRFLPGKRTTTMQCRNPTGLRLAPGDAVQVRFSDSETPWLSIVAQAYGIPTLGMLLGTAGGHLAAGSLRAGVNTDVVSNSGIIMALVSGLPALGFALGLAGGLFAWNRIAKSKVAKNHDTEGCIVGTLVSKP